MESDWEAQRIRSLILLRATCEKAIPRLDEDDIEDIALGIQITELCDTLDNEFARFPHRGQPTSPAPESA